MNSQYCFKVNAPETTYWKTKCKKPKHPADSSLLSTLSWNLRTFVLELLKEQIQYKSNTARLQTGHTPKVTLAQHNPLLSLNWKQTKGKIIWDQNIISQPQSTSAQTGYCSSHLHRRHSLTQNFLQLHKVITMHCGDFSLFEGGAKTPSPACDLESLGRGNGVYFLFSLLIDSRFYYGVKNYSSYTPEIFQQKQRGILFCKLFPMQRIKAFAFL